ncbi:cytochrome P450 [Mycobacterium sp. OTB74]|jgi:cytochrome P450|uniref:cytochrome P450 n=1 Tax=Mycobacterium sp. OTB74 TaxID=1853452 RepID=UPI002475F14C|nr:cytochrome P450 [Mycobacterium sp. OTB74]MDH6244436.1 cytochrome P450 [Mycobacterium sp. OTB74]
MIEAVDVAALPLAPLNPLPPLQQMKAVRAFHTGCEVLRDAGGPVTRLAHAWMLPTFIVTTSPKGARDVLTRNYPFVDRAQPVFVEHQRLIGGSLFNFKHEAWLPRRRALQPLFTKQHVTEFATHMADCANPFSPGWVDGAELDLDKECRRLTLRVLSRTILGLDLDARAAAVVDPLLTAAMYITNRAVRPVRAPWWLPTPARRRARAASAELHRHAYDVLQACRADPALDARLVRALTDVTDPETGKRLSDEDICHELVVFLGAGYDTTATTLTYALWALGRHTHLQDRVAAEVAALGERPLTSDDVPRLGYTVQVLCEALRLCPPAPVITRMVMKDFDVGGYRVQAGNGVMVGVYAMHRDPSLWDHPLVFDPDRFSPESSSGRDRWQYLPFGGGPRSCIGDHFAMLEAALGLATVIRHTEFHSIDADFPLAVPFTMVAAAPIRVRVRRRN